MCDGGHLGELLKYCTTAATGLFGNRSWRCCFNHLTKSKYFFNNSSISLPEKRHFWKNGISGNEFKKQTLYTGFILPL